MKPPVAGCLAKGSSWPLDLYSSHQPDSSQPRAFPPPPSTEWPPLAPEANPLLERLPIGTHPIQDRSSAILLSILEPEISSTLETGYPFQREERPLIPTAGVTLVWHPGEALREKGQHAFATVH